MLHAKILWFCFFLLLGLWLTLFLLNQLPSFKEIAKEHDMNFLFEGPLWMVAFVLCFIGIYVNGYERGLKDGKTESNKT